eukprot:TRINITY_DN3995_c1_g1_i3.p1 TRINITY_DN3995_c1_g1~~TRINITY_DN3995_c1_g1_i3.p1  ORF type:complete len:151 (+),score=40.13 TRINITY_DN3995_c1_g1_i3:118-570(+)
MHSEDEDEDEEEEDEEEEIDEEDEGDEPLPNMSHLSPGSLGRAEQGVVECEALFNVLKSDILVEKTLSWRDLLRRLLELQNFFKHHPLNKDKTKSDILKHRTLWCFREYRRRCNGLYRRVIIFTDGQSIKDLEAVAVTSNPFGMLRETKR